MAKLISASIDLTKIDKSKIVEKNGKKYYNITISVNDDKDQYGNDTSIMQAQSKEEREAGATKIYLGNGKTFWTNEEQKITTTVQAASEPMNEDLPF